jgi:VIT1/CCC1 family predicted Fe2+/Mn2+ transporter
MKVSNKFVSFCEGALIGNGFGLLISGIIMALPFFPEISFLPSAASIISAGAFLFVLGAIFAFWANHRKI